MSAICVDVAKAEAVVQDKNLDSHLAHLVIHGVLHLRGFDHVNEQDAGRDGTHRGRVYLSRLAWQTRMSENETTHVIREAGTKIYSAARFAKALTLTFERKFRSLVDEVFEIGDDFDQEVVPLIGKPAGDVDEKRTRHHGPTISCRLTIERYEPRGCAGRYQGDRAFSLSVNRR